MEQIMSQIWPGLFGALLTAIGLYAGYIRSLIVEVAVLKKTAEDQQRTIDNMTKRLDSQSAKQDEIYDSLNDMKVKLVEEIGNVNAKLGTLSSDLKNLSTTLSISGGIKPNRKK